MEIGFVYNFLYLELNAKIVLATISLRCVTIFGAKISITPCHVKGSTLAQLYQQLRKLRQGFTSLFLIRVTTWRKRFFFY